MFSNKSSVSLNFNKYNYSNMKVAEYKRNIAAAVVAGLISMMIVIGIPNTDTGQTNSSHEQPSSNNNSTTLAEGQGLTQNYTHGDLTLDSGFYRPQAVGHFMAEEGKVWVSSQQEGKKILSLNVTQVNDQRTLILRKDNERIYSKKVSNFMLHDNQEGKHVNIQLSIPLQLEEGMNAIKIISKQGCSVPDDPNEERCLSIAIGESQLKKPDSQSYKESK